MQGRPSYLAMLALSAALVAGSLNVRADGSDAKPETPSPTSQHLALTPVLGLTTSNLSFGCLPLGDSERLNIVVHNDTPDFASLLEITAVTVTGSGFSMTPVSLPVTIPGNGSIHRFGVVFGPESAGMSIGTLTFESNGLDPIVEVPLLGHGGEENPPVADPGGPYHAECWEIIQFDGTASHDPDGDLIAYYRWQLGEVGSTRYGTIVSYSYVSPGIYDATLRVRDYCGVTTDTDFQITIGDNVVPVCVTDSTIIARVRSTIVFDGSRSYDPDGIIDTAYWEFGDGQSASGTIVEHVYHEIDTYGATFRIRDNYRAWSECQTLVDVAVRPICDAGGPYVGTSNVALEVDGSGSYEGGSGPIVRYRWSFGDGSTGGGATTAHVYGPTGSYTITLTVTNDRGLTTSCGVQATITGHNALPVCAAGEIAVAQLDSSVVFSGQGSHDPDGQIEGYAWDFGDGGTAAGPVVEHVYTAANIFTVTLCVTDSVGSRSFCSNRTRVNFPPICWAGDTVAGSTGEPVTFLRTHSGDFDGWVSSFVWEFGDGSSADGGSHPAVTHNYLAAGQYTVTLSIIDNDGARVQCNTSATITAANIPPVCDAGGPYDGIMGEPLEFDGSASHDLDGSIVTYLWRFGDGTVANTAVAMHAYGPNGTFTATLITTDDEGAESTCDASVTITGDNAFPICILDAPLTGNAWLPVLLDGSESYDPDGRILAFEWEFGDGVVSSGWTVAHIYGSVQVFTVTFCVTDDVGASACCNAEIDINNYAPICALATSWHSNPGVELGFGCGDCRDVDGEIVEYAWEFGDGSTSNTPAIWHAYESYGIYTVTLCLTDDVGVLNCCNATVLIDDVNPVTLTYFDTAVLDGAVHIEWRTGFEANLLGFNLLRSDRATPDRIVRINTELIVGHGPGDGTYSFIDPSVESGRSYGYWLETIDLDGSSMRHGPSWITTSPERPARLALEPNRPNPFNPRTTITFALPEPMLVELWIYDAAGRPVRTLVSGWRAAAVHSVEWDGFDDAGTPSPSGVYFVRLHAAGVPLTHKMVLIR